MKSKNKTNDIITYLSGVPLVIIIFGSLLLFSLCSIKTEEKKKAIASVNNDITIKDAPLLDIEAIKISEMADTPRYRLLKLDVNKNGVFDEEDVIVKTTSTFELEKGKDVFYFENKENNERGVIAYQDKDNNYILNNNEKFFNSRKITKSIFEKLPEYLTDNRQRQ